MLHFFISNLAVAERNNFVMCHRHVREVMNQDILQSFLRQTALSTSSSHQDHQLPVKMIINCYYMMIINRYYMAL